MNRTVQKITVTENDQASIQSKFELDTLSNMFIVQMKQHMEAYFESSTTTDIQKTYIAKHLHALIDDFSNSEILQPMASPNKWKNRGRKNRSMSPIDFLRANYPTLDFNLHMAHVAKFDSGLATALRNLKSSNNGKWPDGFKLPTFSEYLDEQLDVISNDKLQYMTKLVEAAKTRKRKKSTN